MLARICHFSSPPKKVLLLLGLEPAVHLPLSLPQTKLCPLRVSNPRSRPSPPFLSRHQQSCKVSRSSCLPEPPTHTYVHGGRGTHNLFSLGLGLRRWWAAPAAVTYGGEGREGEGEGGEGEGGRTSATHVRPHRCTCISLVSGLTVAKPVWGDQSLLGAGEDMLPPSGEARCLTNEVPRQGRRATKSAAC